jgi:hypothetical protein
MCPPGGASAPPPRCRRVNTPARCCCRAPPPQEAAAALPEPQQPAAPAGDSSGGGGGAGSPAPLSAAVIWFHHIKSLEKRKTIVAAARSLGVRGYSKPGFPGARSRRSRRHSGCRAAGLLPGCCGAAVLRRCCGAAAGGPTSLPPPCPARPAGVVVAEGPEEQVEELVARIRALRWQAMQVRGRERLPPRGGAQPDWRFAQPFAELAESGMSELAARCAEAGLQQLFLAALKLDAR